MSGAFGTPTIAAAAEKAQPAQISNSGQRQVQWLGCLRSLPMAYLRAISAHPRLALTIWTLLPTLAIVVWICVAGGLPKIDTDLSSSSYLRADGPTADRYEALSSAVDAEERRREEAALASRRLAGQPVEGLLFAEPERSRIGGTVTIYYEARGSAEGAAGGGGGALAAEGASTVGSSTHSLVAPLDELGGHGPDHDGPLLARRHDEGLVGRDGGASDAAAMADADGLANAFVVIPQLEEPLLAPGHVVRSALRDRQRRELPVFGALEHADRLAVEGVPIADLPVAACRQQLGLVGVIDDRLEERGLKEAEAPGLRVEVPDDTGAVSRSGHRLRIVPAKLDAVHAVPVLLQRRIHCLGLPTYPPDPHLALHAA
mmetsp:Transcript_119080/g.299486  ORF Transcript_119080/g.299486 Transcript_119080/m.299486 type:complete len:373 (+) Transcript_119080:45-1163(+)